MSGYVGKYCPYCKTELKPDDDIVVCSACDMPHHKDCWVENQGCTTFGCMGTIKSADGMGSTVTATHMTYEDAPAAAPKPHVFCTQCGSKNDGSASFCVRCGNRLTTAPAAAPAPQPQPAPAYTYSQPQPDPAGATGYSYGAAHQNAGQYNASQNAGQYNAYQGYQGTVDRDVQLLIETKTEYYIPKFQTMKAQNKNTSWNWPAFLITPYWMIYRKMYGYGAATLAADVLIALLGSQLLSWLLFAAYVVLGIYGNGIYMNFLEKKAAQASAMGEPYKSQFIAANRGVNMLAAVASCVIRMIVVSMILF